MADARDDRKIVSLNGKWKIRQLDGDVDLDGNVPGLVHHDLIEQGTVDDPFCGMNEAEQQWVGNSTWEYSRKFFLSEEQTQKKAVVLNCDCLDTIAKVYINGNLIGSTDNMFIRWRWNIKDYVATGENTVKIIFSPVNPVMEERGRAYHLDLRRQSHTPWGPVFRNFVRKSPTHGDWDWGPCFLTQGIPQDIYVECRDGARILYANNTQEHRKGCVDVTFRTFIEMPAAGRVGITYTFDGADTVVEADLTEGENTVLHTISVHKARLWWPAGYGEQYLYPIRIEARANGEADALEQKIGLRTIELVTEDDQAGKSFFFRVNGLPVFARGANWIPGDSFATRFGDERLEWALKSAVSANHNMIRIWGGGLYESELFYELCDRLGLMVWQECIFACGHYPVNREFLESVRTEVRQQVRRIAAHPSLALWCGNNEIEQLFKRDNPNFDTFLVEYDELFIGCIMPIVQEEAPQVRYWPSSASNGVRVFGNPQDETRGDVHFWEVWHGGKPASRYLEVKPRFSSEFGFQSFSSAELMERYIASPDRNVSSRVMDFHQRNFTGSSQIFQHILSHFQNPAGYGNTVYISQALQALYMKIACEHWYRIKPHNMGCLIWQLNDIWPVTSWSSLEYEGRWKILHYYEKKFFAPLLVSCFEEEGKLRIWGTSEINETLNGTLKVRLLDFNGREFLSETPEVSIRPMESKCLASYSLKDLCPDEEDRYTRFVAVDLECVPHSVGNEHFFAVFKHLALRKPDIIWQLENRKPGEFVMKIESSTLTPFTWIRTGGVIGKWSDNGMHLRPGEPRELTFTPRREAAGDISIEELKKRISIQNLYESVSEKST